MLDFLEFRKNISNELLKYTNKKVTLKKGEFLFFEKFCDDKICILSDGMVNYYHTLLDDKEISLGCYSSGSFLVLGDLVKTDTNCKNEISQFTLKASCDSTLEFISLKTFENDIKTNPELYYKLLQYYGLFYEKIFYQIRDIQMFNIEKALLSILIRAYNTYGECIDGDNIVNHKMLNNNLAKCLGSTEETVSRTISKLKKDRILSKKNGLWVINDIDNVKEMLGCKYCKECLCYL